MRKELAERFYAEEKDYSLRISETWPTEEEREYYKPTFWVISGGEEPPQWMRDGEIPIIQFFFSENPSEISLENSSGLITPYIPKPMSFTGLYDLFRDSLRLWSSSCLVDVQSLSRARRVVIIEDEESQQFLMREALEEMGFRSKAIFFESGPEALDGIKEMIAEDRPPLMLFLDLLLPGMGGDEVLKALKSSDELRSIPVALLTGAQSTEELSFLKSMPRHFCFKLPLLESDAIDLIHRCLNYFRHAKPIP